MKYRVEDLTGALLDAAVAKAEGLRYAVERFAIKNPDPERHMTCWLLGQDGRPDFKHPYQPHLDWAIAGTLIERERMVVSPSGDGDWAAGVDGRLQMSGDVTPEGNWTFGPTPLVAAMRRHVKAKLGEEIEL